MRAKNKKVMTIHFEIKQFCAVLALPLIINSKSSLDGNNHQLGPWTGIEE